MKKRRTRKRKLLSVNQRVFLAALLTVGIVIMYATAPSWQLSDTPASAKSDDKVHSDGRSSDPGKTPAVDADTIVAKNPAHNVTPVYNALPPRPGASGY